MAPQVVVDSGSQCGGAYTDESWGDAARESAPGKGVPESEQAGAAAQRRASRWPRAGEGVEREQQVGSSPVPGLSGAPQVAALLRSVRCESCSMEPGPDSGSMRATLPSRHRRTTPDSSQRQRQRQPDQVHAETKWQPLNPRLQPMHDCGESASRLDWQTREPPCRRGGRTGRMLGAVMARTGSRSSGEAGIRRWAMPAQIWW